MSSFYPGYDVRERRSQCCRPRRTYRSIYRHVRDIKPYEKPLLTQQTSNCRILQSTNGDLRKRCDKIVETRPLEYKEAIALFPQGTDLTTNFQPFTVDLKAATRPKPFRKNRLLLFLTKPFNKTRLAFKRFIRLIRGIFKG